MKIDILTLFPEMFSSLKESIIGRAINEEKVEINVINIRDFSTNKHKQCDDTPFGGGAGMVMSAQPLYDAIMSVKTEKSKTVLMSPRGTPWQQSFAKEYSLLEHLIIVCGHYEGIDERIIELCIDEQISIGDFVLTGGEIPAMAITDSIVRLIPGVITSESLNEESFSNYLLEYPQYTRPQEFCGLAVPEVLLSGHHKNINQWRLEQAEKITKKYRPDLYRKYEKIAKNNKK